MELQDTVELMNSAEYKDRFKAEYWQAKIRYDKLDDMTVKYEANTLTFIPKCSLDLLKEQKKAFRKLYSHSKDQSRNRRN